MKLKTDIEDGFMEHPTDGRTTTGSLKRSSSFKKLLKLPLWGNSNSNSNSGILSPQTIGIDN
jgi:hypothetical protein